MNPAASVATDSAHVDELRYLFIVSQVEILEAPDALQGLKTSSESDSLGVGVVPAEGTKCDRCWNYSLQVGTFAAHPTLCERCVEAIDGNF